MVDGEYSPRIESDKLVDSLRTLADLAVQQEDRTEMLNALNALGNIAASLTDPQASVSPTTYLEKQVTANSENTETSYSQPPIPAFDENDGRQVESGLNTLGHNDTQQLIADHSQQPENIKDKPLDEPAGVQQIPLVANNGQEQVSHINRSVDTPLPDLDLTNREKQLLEVLNGRAGQKVSPSDLGKFIDTPSQATRRQVVTVFFRKLKQSPYANHLEQEGATRSRRYTWNPPKAGTGKEVTNKTSDGDQDNPHPSPAMMPQSRIEHPASRPKDSKTIPTESSEPQTNRLESLGIEFCDNGTRYATINKIPLNLKGIGINVLQAVAESDSGKYYSELLAELDARGDTPKIKNINQALKEIASIMEEHGLPWQDEIVIESEVKKRLLSCHMPLNKVEVQADFLD